LIRRNRRPARRIRLSFELQVFAPQMGRMPPGLAEACPKVTFCPAARRHAGRSFAARPLRLARRHDAARACPNVVSKLSGLGTFIHRNDPRTIRSSADTVAIFGADRCLFGSNFPIENFGPAIANWWTPIAPRHATFAPTSAMPF
jgi:predicted TIM-barrel fold metal-dependent hydrolase